MSPQKKGNYNQLQQPEYLKSISEEQSSPENANDKGYNPKK